MYEISMIYTDMSIEKKIKNKVENLAFFLEQLG